MSLDNVIIIEEVEPERFQVSDQSSDTDRKVVLHDGLIDDLREAIAFGQSHPSEYGLYFMLLDKGA